MKARDQLISKLQQSEEVIRYKKLEQIILNDKALKEKIEALKKIQKQMINANHYGKKDLHQRAKASYDQMLESIYEHPLLVEYLDLQNVLNQTIQEIILVISEGIEKDIEQ